MLYRAILLFLGLVLGRSNGIPCGLSVPIRVLGFAVVIVLRFALKPLVCLPWRAWRVIDGPTARAFAVVMGLIVLVNLLASSSALAGWATLFIVGASRGLTGPSPWASDRLTLAIRHAGRYPSPSAVRRGRLRRHVWRRSPTRSYGARRATSPRRCAVAIRP